MSLSDGPQIWLTKRGQSRHWVIRYEDPETGGIRQRSTRTASKREAERQLGQLRADLVNRRVRPDGNTSWAEFRQRYEDEVLCSLAHATLHKATVILNAVERVLHPQRLRDITSERISFLLSRLREGRADTTVVGYVAHLKAALRWAVDIGMLGAMPKIPRARRGTSSKIMKGRPITDGEFGRMLLCIPGVVGVEVTESWRRYLCGLWWSGLRVTESLDFYWDDRSKLCVVREGGELMLRIPGELEKGKKDRLLPIAPEFADFLDAWPEAERTGRVFRPLSQRGGGTPVSVDRVVRVLGEIGKAADVVVDSAKKKWASAHDLRRSFGERWASRVMPAVLMELMRHESIETTLKYYVGRNAMRTTRELREAFERSNSKEAKEPAS